MTTITLNLISPEQRRKLRLRWTMDELRSLSVNVLFVAALASAAAFSASYLLATTRDLFTTNAQATVAATKIDDRQISTARLVRGAASVDVDWPSFLARFSQSVPSHVAIASLDVSPDGDVQISGDAATRADLLKFQQQLESSGVVERVYSPVSNLLQPTNISFSLTALLASSTEPRNSKL